MPTKRDDAAYKAAYKEMLNADRCSSTANIAHIIAIRLSAAEWVQSQAEEASLDAATDILMERGLCASVRDWHKKPAGDELEW